MERFTYIIWDFDGTIARTDSEHGLIRYHLNYLKDNGRSLHYHLKKPLVKFVLWADRNGFVSNHVTKHVYSPIFRGVTRSELEDFAVQFAATIGHADRSIIRRTFEQGYRNFIFSCGSEHIIEAVLREAGLADCFEKVVSNPFSFRRERVAWVRLRVGRPEKKVRLMKELGIDPNKTVAIGDGLTDIPLLNSVACPVLVGPGRSLAMYDRASKWVIIEELSDLAGVLNLGP